MSGPSFFYVSAVRAMLERSDSGHYNLRMGVDGVGEASAILALDDAGRTVGALVHDVLTGGRCMISRFTYVAPAWRGKGLATALWDMALARGRVRRVRVTVISDGGMTLVRALERRHPHVRFQVREDAARKLRDKRKAA